MIRADRPRDLRIEDLGDWYEGVLGTARKPSTIRGYRNACQHLAAALGGRTLLTQIDAIGARRVAKYLVAGDRSTSTVKKVLVKLRTIIKRAVQENFATSNPFECVDLPRVQPPQKRIYTPEEVSAMVESSPTLWWPAFVTLAVQSGLRFQELLHLTWRDVDLDRGTVTVAAKRAGRFEVPGSGVDLPIIEWSTKTHAEREVTLGRDTIDVLRQIRRLSDGSLYVFVSVDRLRAIDSKLKAGTLRPDFELVNNVLRNFKAIQRRAFANLDGDHPIGSIHDLRKTYGTRMADAVPMPVLQRLMGHADIQTTARFYIGEADGYADRIREAVRIDAQVTREPRLRLVGGNSPAA